MPDLIERMKASLVGVTDGPWFAESRAAWHGWWDVVDADGCEVVNFSGDGGMEKPQARFIAAARTLLPEAKAEIMRDLRRKIKGEKE